ncbi:hypothetical protein [Duncaniella sp.]|uniref:hypothetical protein n=1 Tax=Duncaniella sp. TaxID=2518496 RepID=UPI0023D39D84|nr:hypothetical protein [Duncaniella sp.]MDE5903897.1 hypothetical protein [Duncaniella sp.]
MIKNLLALFLLISSVASVCATPVVLWQSDSPEGVSVNWGGGPTISAEQCADFTGGGKIEVGVASCNSGAFLLLTKGDWVSGDLCPGVSLDDLTMPATVTFSLTPAQAESAKELGFIPFGTGYNISRISYVPSETEVDPDAIWFGSEDCRSDWKNIDLSAPFFADAKAGDKLVFVTSDRGPEVIMQPIIGNWGGIVLNSVNNPELFTTEGDLISITLTDEWAEKLKEKGFVLQAYGAVINEMRLGPPGGGDAT